MNFSSSLELDNDEMNWNSRSNLVVDKVKRKKAKQKHHLEESESISSFDFSEDSKENSAASFIINNSRTNNSLKNVENSKDISKTNYINLWMGKDSNSLRTSTSVESIPDASSNDSESPLPEEIEDEMQKIAKKDILLVDSLTASEDVPGWDITPDDDIDSLPDGFKGSVTPPSKFLGTLSSLSSVASDESSNELEHSMESSKYEEEISNHMDEHKDSNFPLSLDEMSDIEWNLIPSSQTSIDKSKDRISISSVSEEIKDFSEDNESSEILPNEFQIPKSPESPKSSSPKRKSNRKDVLRDLSKRTSPPPKPKKTLTPKKSKSPKKKKRIIESDDEDFERYEKVSIGKKRKRKELKKSKSLYESKPPRKRPRRITDSPRGNKLYEEDSTQSSLDESSIEIDEKDIKLSSNLNSIIKKKKQKKIFRGFSMIITGMDNIFVSSKVYPNCKTLGDLIKKLVQNHGGKVLTNFTSSCYRNSNKSYPQLSSSILISTESKRTEKYLLSVVNGLPILSYKWIIDCCENQNIIDFEDDEYKYKYQIPVGYSQEKQKSIYLFEQLEHPKYFEYPPNIFNELRCEVVGTVKFKEVWTRVLRAAGAKVVTRLGVSERETKGRGVELVIGEDPVNSFVRKKCEELSIPLCSTEIIIESIFNRKLVSFDPYLIEMNDSSSE